MTAFSRSALQAFEVGNPLYAGAVWRAVTVDASGNPTTTLAPLYADLTSTARLPNPQTLGGNGAFQAPVYIDAPVILQQLSNPQAVPNHSTGVISANLAGDAATQAAVSAAAAQASFGMVASLFSNVRALYNKIKAQGLPGTFTALNMLRVNAGATAYEFRTTAQVVGDLGLNTWVVAGGTADAITATYSPAITSLADGQECRVRATAANATTTPTFSPNGLPAHTITKRGGLALVIGDIPGNLAEILLRYNLANTRWEIVNPTISKQPTRTALTSGTGTYTTPSGATRLNVRLGGGGGGGGGSGTTPGTGGTGGSTTFSTLTASGGTGGTGAAGGGGGNASGGDVNISGGSGAQCASIATSAGGMGASTPFGGGGACGSAGAAAGAAANTGAGGGGAGANGTASPGGGGGAGGYIEKLITAPAATYSYAVGAGGTAGTAGTSGAAGGAGGTGIIIIDEFYS